MLVPKSRKLHFSPRFFVRGTYTKYSFHVKEKIASYLLIDQSSHAFLNLETQKRLKDEPPTISPTYPDLNHLTSCYFFYVQVFFKSLLANGLYRQ